MLLFRIVHWARLASFTLRLLIDIQGQRSGCREAFFSEAVQVASFGVY